VGLAPYTFPSITHLDQDSVFQITMICPTLSYIFAD
jgi:hypothetical protein